MRIVGAAASSLLLVLAACGSGGDSEHAGHGGAAPALVAPPQVVDVGGRVLATPKVIPIFLPGDPAQAEVEAFLGQLAKSAYWSTVTAEYGVGPLTVAPSLVLGDSAPAKLDDADLLNALDANLSGPSPAWGPPDPQAIYLFVVPKSTHLTSDGDSCLDFDGYHGDATVGDQDLAYAVSTGCDGSFDGPGVTDLDQLTIAVSHELIEASTDPLPYLDEAYGQTDDEDAVWTVATGGEVADMCEYALGSYVSVPGIDRMVQRSWSNGAARAGEDPCVPADPAAPYFSSVPVLPDEVTLDYGGPWSTRGVKIGVGERATIEVELHGAPADAGSFRLVAHDFDTFYGTSEQPKLAFEWDHDEGSNGDTRRLTITVLARDESVGGEAFVIESVSGGRSSLSMGVVGH